jgi:flavin reductase (DIM6/NTAB) family NADH-FMN oxidoreductase RutF
MLTEIKTDIYRMLHPKLTFFLTSISRDGKSNVMTCSWGVPVSTEPPMIIVCVAKEAYTAELIRETREFAVCIPTKGQLKALWACGNVSGRDEDKFSKAGVKPVKAKKIKSPLIEGCVGFMECRLGKTVEAGECYAFFGKVVSACADDRFFEKGSWTEEAEIPMHLSGGKMVYFRK